MTPAELVLWFRRDSPFSDTARGAGELGWGFAHATTEEVATALGIDPKEAYRMLSAAKRKGLITERKERVKLRGRRGPNMGEKQVGWALWELDLTQEDWEYRERKSGRMEPNAKAPAIHYRDPVTDKRICNTRLMRETSTTEPHWSELPEHRRCVRCVAELEKRKQTPNASNLHRGAAYKLMSGDQPFSSPSRDWEQITVSETLVRGPKRFLGMRVLFDDSCKVFMMAGRYYAQPEQGLEPNVSHPKYAIDYVLGFDKYTLVVEAEDRDEAYAAARDHLVRSKLFSASIQGTARVATQDDVDAAEGKR